MLELTSRMTASRTSRVLVAGGGVAGLEALLALRDLAGERMDLTLLSPEPDFVYRPMAVAEPFCRGHAAHRVLSDMVDELGVELVRGELMGVDVGGRAAITATGERIGYDALLVTVGARSEPVFHRALTWTPKSDHALFSGLLADLEEGYAKRVAFVVPPGVAWTLPAYELALMTAWQAWGMGQDDVEVTIYTPEDAPLDLIGTRAAAALRHDLDEAGVELHTGVSITEEAQRLVLHPGGRTLEAERVVALPRAIGPAIAGLPADAHGFVLTDLHGKVAGVDGVWAAGDASAFTVKRGGLAAQQADAAAEAIAARAGAAIQLRHDASVAAGEGDASRDAVWWPPTKIAGRYLSPYLAALDDSLRGSPTMPSGSLRAEAREHAGSRSVGR